MQKFLKTIKKTGFLFMKAGFFNTMESD